MICELIEMRPTHPPRRRIPTSVIAAVVALVVSVGITVGGLYWFIPSPVKVVETVVVSPTAASNEVALPNSPMTSELLEEKILLWIESRNNQVSLKGLKGFPQTLLTEAKAAKIDFKLVLALIERESQFNPRAVGNAGEIGLMQLMPATAAIIAKNYGWHDFVPPVRNKSGVGYASLGSLGDPNYNVKIGIAYLKDQIRMFGVSPVALRAYNRGPAKAKERWSSDEYAELISFRTVELVHWFQ